MFSKTFQGSGDLEVWVIRRPSPIRGLILPNFYLNPGVSTQVSPKFVVQLLIVRILELHEGTGHSNAEA